MTSSSMTRRGHSATGVTREDDIQIAARVRIGGIDLHGAPQMLDRLGADAAGRERGPQVPVRRRRLRIELERGAKLGDRLVEASLLREPYAEPVVQVGRLRHDLAQIGAAGD